VTDPIVVIPALSALAGAIIGAVVAVKVVRRRDAQRGLEQLYTDWMAGR